MIASRNDETKMTNDEFQRDVVAGVSPGRHFARSDDFRHFAVGATSATVLFGIWVIVSSFVI
jgi:hypothetical protein